MPTAGATCCARPSSALRYRHSTLPADWIVIEAVLKAAPGDPAAIRARMAAIKAEREASQPLQVATGGSTFKNPGKNPPASARPGS